MQPTTLATLFADAAGQSGIANPVHVDGQGRYQFFTQAGSYNLDVVGTGVVTTLVNIAIVDPRNAHAIGGSNAQAPATLVESSLSMSGGNAAIVLERLRTDGTRVYGPWALHVNKGPTDRKAGIEWLYNADFNEGTQTTGGFITADVGLALRQAPVGALQTTGTQAFGFDFDYAPAGAVGAMPAWTTLLSEDQGTTAAGTLPGARLGGGPFVVSDGLENSSLVARRLNWFCTNMTAPSGVLTRIEGPAPSACFANPPTTCDPCPGDVVVAQLSSVSRATQHAQEDATVYFFGGNGTEHSVLSVGKALVRLTSGAAVNPGDIIVNSGVEPGHAAADNSVTDPRGIVGFAVESAGATLPGYVTILRSNR
jgi:hypothetical protein